MNQCRLFNSLTVQTQCKIIYECGRVTSFKAGDLVYKWHKRSPWNVKEYHQYRVYKPVISTGNTEDNGHLHRARDIASETIPSPLSKKKKSQVFDTLY